MLQFLRREISSIHAAALLVGAAGLLSRALGLLRDRLLAADFGASRTLDIYYASFQIPDFLFTVFLIGAGSAAILPMFLEYWGKDRKSAESFVGSLLSMFALGAAILSIGAAIFAEPISYLTAPGFDAESRKLLVQMTRVMMLSPVFLGISSILSVVVQAERRFFIFVLTSIFYNIGIILGILFFVPRWGVPGLAFGVVLGALLHLLIQIPALSAVGFRPRLASPRSIPGISRVFSLSVPRVLALSLDQIVSIILISLGSLLAAGNIAVFQFSNNLRYLPIGIIGVSYAIAAFPKLSEAALKKSKGQFFEDLRASAVTVLFWVVPLVFFMVLLRAHIVRLALGAGQFTWEDTRLTAAALAVFSVSIICESLTPLLLRSFYALGNTRFPMLASLFTAIFISLSAPFFLRLFTSGRISGHLIASLLKVGDIPGVGVLGLALAFSVGTVLYVILLALGLSREIRIYFGAPMAYPGTLPILRIFFAALMAAVLGYGVLYLLSLVISLSTFWGVFTEAALTFTAAALFYAGLSYVMGSPEIESFLEVFRRRLVSPAEIPTSVEDPKPTLK